MMDIVSFGGSGVYRKEHLTSSLPSLGSRFLLTSCGLDLFMKVGVICQVEIHCFVCVREKNSIIKKCL